LISEVVETGDCGGESVSVSASVWVASDSEVVAVETLESEDEDMDEDMEGDGEGVGRDQGFDDSPEPEGARGDVFAVAAKAASSSSSVGGVIVGGGISSAEGKKFLNKCSACHFDAFLNSIHTSIRPGRDRAGSRRSK
jgi:hypothetical protein